MTPQHEFESELVGVSPLMMGQILFFLMIVVPLGAIPVLVPVPFDLEWFYYVPMVYGIFWTLIGTQFELNFAWFDYNFLLHVTPTIILNIIFILFIVRYYNAIASKWDTIAVGIFSFLFPLGIDLFLCGYFSIEGAFTESYYGPYPLMLIIGLIMLYRVPGPIVDIPTLSSFTGDNEEEESNE